MASYLIAKSEGGVQGFHQIGFGAFAFLDA
jgi:hypothetical protein